MSSPVPLDNKVLLAAMAAYDQGRRSLADALCRICKPQSAANWNLLGRIAMDARRPDVALENFRRAIDVDPRFKPALKNLKAAEAGLATPSPQPKGERYLVIRSWGHGFWSDVDHALGQLLLAEITGRTPVVYWGPECLFTDDPRRDAWTSFFEPASSVPIEDLLHHKGPIFPELWSPATLLEPRDAMKLPPEERPGAVEFLTREEPVCVSHMHMGLASITPWLALTSPLRALSIIEIRRDLVRRHLRPVASMRERVDRFAREHFVPGKMLALHIRGSDKILEDPTLAHEIESLIAMASERLATSDWRLFLLTDWLPALNRLSSMFPGRVVSTPATRTDESTGIHYQHSASRRALGEEVLLDALLAARCDAFMGLNTSSVSFAVSSLKAWPNDSLTMLGEEYYTRPNAFTLLTPARR